MRWAQIPGVVAALSIAGGCAVAAGVRGGAPRRAVTSDMDGAAATTGAAPGVVELRRRVRAILDRYGVPGAGIVLANGDRVLWAGGVGVADRSTGRAVTADTPFRLGSVSKNLTALALMRLVESGRLSLDDRVRELAPDVSFENPWEDTHPVIVAQLLEHTTGFEMARFNEQFDDRLPPRPLADALRVNPRSRRSRWPPGTRTSYSNEGYLVAGRLLEEVTGRSFDDVLADEVLTPLGMTTAAFRLSPPIRGSLARGYGSGGTEYAYAEDMMRPAANLIASPNDMGRYLRMWLGRGEVDGRRLLSQTGLRRMEERRTLPYPGPGEQYGLGTEVAQYGGHIAHGHTGYTLGFRASFRYFPREGAGWTVMLNSSDSEGALAEIEGELAGLVMKDSPPPAALPPVRIADATLRHLVGFYGDVAPSGALGAAVQRLFVGEELRVRDGVLWERQVGQGGALGLLRRTSWQPLIPVGEGEFRREGEAVSTLYLTRAPGGDQALVTRDGYLQRESGWTGPAERVALLSCLVVLAAAVVAAPLLWFVPALLGGHRPAHTGALVPPAVAAISGALTYVLLSRAPQPLAEMNATTLGICLLSGLFALCSVLGLAAALHAATDGAGWLVRVLSLPAAAACAPLTVFAATQHWILLRTWSW